MAMLTIHRFIVVTAL